MPEFVEVGSPTDDEVHALLQAIITRLMKMLTRWGVLVEDMGQTYMAEPDADGQESRTPRPQPARLATVSLRLGKVGLTQQESRNTAITAVMALFGSIRGLEDVAARGLPPYLKVRRGILVVPTGTKDFHCTCGSAIIAAISCQGGGRIDEESRDAGEFAETELAIDEGSNRRGSAGNVAGRAGAGHIADDDE